LDSDFGTACGDAGVCCSRKPRLCRQRGHGHGDLFRRVIRCRESSPGRAGRCQERGKRLAWVPGDQHGRLRSITGHNQGNGSRPEGFRHLSRNGQRIKRHGREVKKLQHPIDPLDECAGSEPRQSGAEPQAPVWTSDPPKAGKPLPSALRHLSSAPCPPPPALCPLPSNLPIRLRTSDIRPLISDICFLSSAPCPLPSNLYPPTSAPLPSVLYPLSSAPCPLPPVLRHLSSVFRLLSSALCLLSSVLRVLCVSSERSERVVIISGSRHAPQPILIDNGLYFILPTVLHRKYSSVRLNRYLSGALCRFYSSAILLLSRLLPPNNIAHVLLECPFYQRAFSTRSV